MLAQFVTADASAVNSPARLLGTQNVVFARQQCVSGTLEDEQSANAGPVKAREDVSPKSGCRKKASHCTSRDESAADEEDEEDDDDVCSLRSLAAVADDDVLTDCRLRRRLLNIGFASRQ
jgi:hypothetical protein